MLTGTSSSMTDIPVLYHSAHLHGSMWTMGWCPGRHTQCIRSIWTASNAAVDVHNFEFGILPLDNTARRSREVVLSRRYALGSGRLAFSAVRVMHSRVTDVVLPSSVIGAMSCIEHMQDHSTGMALVWCKSPLIPWNKTTHYSLATRAFCMRTSSVT